MERYEDLTPPSRLADAVVDAAATTPPSLVVTDVPSLAPALRRRGLRGLRFIPAFDVMAELYALADHSNGQYASVIACCERRFELVGALWPCALPRHRFAPGDLVVLHDDRRSAQLVPRAVWAPFTELVATVDGARILRFVRGGSVTLPPPPPWINPSVYRGPCAR
ncbi:MAG: hypothetical protein R3A52_20705 [Polyangiales bacterium]